MRRATAHVPAGSWPEEGAVATVTLPWHERHRRRLRFFDDAGAPFLLDLPAAARLADGDGLALAEGGIVRVRAAAEAVVDLACDTPARAARLAWHIGNRHVPLQVLSDTDLRVGDDPVVVAMALGLGATPKRHQAPFAPEGGAYEAALGAHPPIPIARRAKAVGDDRA
jgi:urease accessory protein